MKKIKQLKNMDIEGAEIAASILGQKLNMYKIDEASSDNKFVANNWLVNDKNPILVKLDQTGAALWMQTGGNAAFRPHPDADIESLTLTQAKNVLSSHLRQTVIVSHAEKADIKPSDLLLVDRKDTFDPHVRQEFYSIKGKIFRNTFRLTPYMELDKNQPYETPTAIMALLNHLVRGDEERVDWVINWLAYFFQGLRKSPVALFLKGAQGAGKGILYSEILEKLFGKDQSIQVNDKSVQGQFLGGLFEAKLLINLDEISTGMTTNKQFKNQLKALISNEYGTFEKKYETLTKETRLYGQVLITSNEPKAVEIERNDRRFVVFETGGNISHTDFLGYGSYDALIEAIRGELEDFALMLLNYEFDVHRATTAIDTPEKEALIAVSSNRFKLFSDALKSKDLEFFEDLKEKSMFSLDGGTLYDNLVKSFHTNRIDQSQLKHFFGAMFGEISTQKIRMELEAIDPIFWGNENSVMIKGKRFYKLDSEYNDAIKRWQTPEEESSSDEQASSSLSLQTPPPPPQHNILSE